MQSPRVKGHLTTHFFKLLRQRNLTQAERTLEEVSQEVKNTEWRRGYFHALRGMLIASKSGDDKRAFINRMKDRDLSKIRRDFAKKSRDPLQTSFDRGFFAAWADYVEFSEKAELIQREEKRESRPQETQAEDERKV